MPPSRNHLFQPGIDYSIVSIIDSSIRVRNDQSVVGLYLVDGKAYVFIDQYVNHQRMIIEYLVLQNESQRTVLEGVDNYNETARGISRLLGGVAPLETLTLNTLQLIAFRATVEQNTSPLDSAQSIVTSGTIIRGFELMGREVNLDPGLGCVIC